MLYDKLLLFSKITISSGSYGYIAGANTGSSAIKKINVEVDSATANISATLSYSTWASSSVSTSSNAFNMGGAGTYPTTINKFNLASEAISVPSATLALGRMNAVGMSSSTNGYGITGYNGADRTEIDGLSFSTETSINPSATASFASGYSECRGFQKGTTSGIMGGGNGSSLLNSTMEFTFSTETSSTLGATLSVSRGFLATVWSSSNGYWCGGFSSVNYSDIDGINLSTNAAINPSATLTAANRGCHGFNGVSKGLIAGGQAANTVDELTFSTETRSARTNSLNSTVYYGTSLQGL